MFFKLLKHNLTSVLKSILPFIIFLLAAVIMMNITSYDRELGYIEIAGVMSQTVLDPPAAVTFWNGLAQFLIYISLILLLAASVRANWRRFSNSFYSDEAYLTHTLPVSRTVLWGSMVATILLSLLTVIIVLAFSGFLLALSGSGQRFLDSLGLLGGCVNCFGDYYSLAPREISFYLSYAFVLLAEFVFLILCGITGIILKNRFSKNISLISGVLIYLLGNFLLLGLISLISNFDNEILNMFESTIYVAPESEPNFDYMTRALLYISCIYTCYSITLYFVDYQLLKRGINLD